MLIGAIIYRCIFDGILLCCIDYPETETILYKAHDRVCGGHFGT